MSADKPPSNSSVLLKVVIILLVILIILITSALALFGWYYFRFKPSGKLTTSPSKNEQTTKITPDQTITSPTSLPSPTSSPTIAPSPTIQESAKTPYTENTDVPGQKHYVNPRLGINFLYLENQNGQTILTKEVGDKVYLYFKGQPYDSGQYVEVFSKNPELSLKETLAKKFLTGYSNADCQVKMLETPESYPDILQVADIEAVGADFSDDPFSKWEKCPETYTRTNGVSFFVFNPTAADKFAFVSVGQFAILADHYNHGWQDTLALTN